MESIVKQFEKIGIIPVIALDDAKDAEKLGKALIDGGLPAAEVTFRTDAAEESIRIMAEKCPSLLVGAGTVLTIEQVNRAIDAGGKFIVSPGLNPKIVRYCLDRGIAVIPGTQTPSDMEQALELGLRAVKFFPAELSGGLKMIKAIAAPYTTLRFMPSGGVSPENVREYFAYDKIFACGGSWMVKKDLIQGGEWDKLTTLVREAADIVKECRG